MARIYLATEENQNTIINNQNTIKQNQSTIKTDQNTLKQDHVSMKKNQDEMLKLLKQGGDEEISTMAVAWIQGVNAHVSNWIVSTGKVGQVLNKLGGGLYSAINNCTTVKQVLDNAATWQQMVKNNLIVYCIEQSDDFMRTLVDYPDRLYELVSNEYMQTLMGRSGRNYKLPSRSYSDDPISGAFIITKIVRVDGSNSSSTDSFTISQGSSYSDGSDPTAPNYYGIKLSTSSYGGNMIKFYLEKRKFLSKIKYSLDTDYDAVTACVYDLTKPTI